MTFRAPPCVMVN
jgi:hypothetical protein